MISNLGIKKAMNEEDCSLQASENSGVKRQTERQSVTQMFLNAPVLHYLTLAVPEVYLCLIVLQNNASTPNHSGVVQILLKILSGIWRKRFKLHILPKCLKVPIRDFFSKSRIFLPLLFHHTLTNLVDSFPSPVFSGSSNTFPL